MRSVGGIAIRVPKTKVAGGIGVLAGLSPQAYSGLRGHRKGHAMTNAQYRILLEHLGLNVVEAGRVLGISPRQAQRYAAKDAIPAPVAKLVRLMVVKDINPKEVEAL